MILRPRDGRGASCLWFQHVDTGVGILEGTGLLHLWTEKSGVM